MPGLSNKSTSRVCSIGSEPTSMHAQVLLCDDQLQNWQQGTYLGERSPQEAPCSEQVKITLRAWILDCHTIYLTSRMQAPMQIYTATLHDCITHALAMQRACSPAATDHVNTALLPASAVLVNLTSCVRSLAATAICHAKCKMSHTSFSMTDRLT